jgi:hydrogenase maturation protease
LRILCIGNPDRGDDGVGRAAAGSLKALVNGRAEILELDGAAAELLAGLEGAAAAFVIDACLSGAEPGALRRFDVTDAPLPQTVSCVSSHGLGLHEAIELARALGVLPRPCIIYLVEGEVFDLGATMTPGVARAAAHVAARIHRDLVGDHPSANPPDPVRRKISSM